MSEKVAILLSGHTRSIKYTINNILKLKNCLNSDIFIHTWSEVNQKGKHIWKKENETYDISVEDNISLIKKKLEPKLFKIEKNSVDINDLKCDRKVYSNTLSMVIGIYKAFNLLKSFENKNSFKYTHIIRYRFDLEIESVNRIKNSILNLNANCVLLVRHNWASCLGVYSDIFIALTRKNFENSIVDMKNIITTKINNYPSKNLIMPEKIITDIFLKNKLSIKLINTRVAVVSKDGKITQEFNCKNSLFQKVKDYIYLYDYYLKQEPSDQKLLDKNFNKKIIIVNLLLKQLIIIYSRIKKVKCKKIQRLFS